MVTRFKFNFRPKSRFQIKFNVLNIKGSDEHGPNNSEYGLKNIHLRLTKGVSKK